MTNHNRDSEKICVKNLTVKNVSDLIYHFVHQIVLCAHRVEIYSEIMTNVMMNYLIICIICTCDVPTSLLLFSGAGKSETNDDLLLLSYVRWFSKGSVPESFRAIYIKIRP